MFGVIWSYLVDGAEFLLTSGASCSVQMRWAALLGDNFGQEHLHSKGHFRHAVPSMSCHLFKSLLTQSKTGPWVGLAPIFFPFVSRFFFG